MKIRGVLDGAPSVMYDGREHMSRKKEEHELTPLKISCRGVPYRGGGVTKWTPEVNEELVEFFSVEPYREIERMSKNGNTYIETFPNKLPFISAFERSKGFCIGLLAIWASDPDVETKYPGFLRAYKYAKALQKEFLVQNGLAGLSPAPSWIFTAKNLTDWRDKTEIDHTSGGRPITVRVQSFLDAQDADTPPSLRPEVVPDGAVQGG